MNRQALARLGLELEQTSKEIVVAFIPAPALTLGVDTRGSVAIRRLIAILKRRRATIDGADRSLRAVPPGDEVAGERLALRLMTALQALEAEPLTPRMVEAALEITPAERRAWTKRAVAPPRPCRADGSAAGDLSTPPPTSRRSEPPAQCESGVRKT